MTELLPREDDDASAMLSAGRGRTFAGSHANDPQRRIEMPYVRHVRRDDSAAMPLCAQNDRGVDHVRRSTDATKLTVSASAFIIEWLYTDR